MENSVMTLSNIYLLGAYVLPVVLVSIWVTMKKKREVEYNRLTLEDNVRSGLTEPASLHPVIDGHKCIGCGSCADACPENGVLGLIDGKMELINPTSCIGHGACKQACPTNAIKLVFGTAQRGIDIPYVDQTFETNVPGIYIAGELGGMGLIRNAITQGRQAVDAMAVRPGMGSGDEYDVVIIGAGPAGLAASLACMQHKLRYVTLEQECLGGSVAHFPRGKLVMTAPFELPLVGKFNIRETTKEELLTLWRKIEQKSGVRINYKEKMETIERDGEILKVKTSQAEYRTKCVLLAIGRRGTPRKLDVPGEEDFSKVVYSLCDPEFYRGKHVLVVGGGNSALEAATSLAEEPNTTVTLSYRGESFNRSAKKNRQKLADAQAKGKVNVLLKSQVKKIQQSSVVIEHEGNVLEIPNNIVIVNAGGELPTPFLKEVGIMVETKYGTA